jgi:hypothetical protein
MNGICAALLNGGSNRECKAAMAEIKNVIITDKDVSFSYTDKEVLSNWTNKIKQDLSISVLSGIINYNVTTDDPNIITNPVGKNKSVTNNPIPSFEFFLKTNTCDFKEVLQTLQGGSYGVFFEMEDGTIEGWTDQSGSEIGYFKPFIAEVMSNTKGAQDIDANEAFRLYIGFEKYSQVENYFMFLPSWGVDELMEATPVGLAMLKTAIFAADDQAVNIKVRCANGYVGLVVADFETSLTMSNVSTPAVTAVVDDGGGNYTLTIQKSVAPESIVAGDLVVLRANKLSASDTTHLSGWITVEGV